MTFEELQKIETESLQVNETYNIFNEDSRLSHSKSARVEFLTTISYIESYLTPTAKILDIGAGTGAYSLYLAAKGFQVDAVELADRNVAAFREKITPDMKLTLTQGTALDLSQYESDSYDIVLLMGPLYHLHKKMDRDQAIAEAKRVCKKDGVIFFAFINHDMVFMTELMYDSHYFQTGDYDHETMRLHDFPFVFFTVSESRQMLEENGIQIEKAIAQDGSSELMANAIDAMDDFEYAQYLKYHHMVCEKPEMLGMSNHLLYIGSK